MFKKLAVAALMASSAAAGTLRGNAELKLANHDSEVVRSLLEQFENLKSQAGEGVTPTTKTGLQRLIEIVDETVLPAITEAHEADKQLTQEQFSRVTDCDTQHTTNSARKPMIERDQEVRTDLVEEFEAAKSSLAQCRGNLKSLENERNSVNNNRQNTCCDYEKRFTNEDLIPLEVPVVNCDFKHETKESCVAKITAKVEDTKAFIKEEKARHDRELGVCNSNKAAEATLKAKVEAKISSITDQETELSVKDNRVTVLNNQIANLVEAGNTEYTTCRNTEDANSAKLHASCAGGYESPDCGLQDKVEQRKREWEGIHELRCIFATYAETATDDTFDDAKQEACSSQINTDHLTITPPALPTRKELYSDTAAVIALPAGHTTTPENEERGCVIPGTSNFAMVTEPACPNWCPSTATAPVSTSPY